MFKKVDKLLFLAMIIFTAFSVYNDFKSLCLFWQFGILDTALFPYWVNMFNYDEYRVKNYIDGKLRWFSSFWFILIALGFILLVLTLINPWLILGEAMMVVAYDVILCLALFADKKFEFNLPGNHTLLVTRNLDYPEINKD